MLKMCVVCGTRTSGWSWRERERDGALTAREAWGKMKKGYTLIREILENEGDSERNWEKEEGKRRICLQSTRFPWKVQGGSHPT